MTTTPVINGSECTLHTSGAPRGGASLWLDPAKQESRKRKEERKRWCQNWQDRWAHGKTSRSSVLGEKSSLTANQTGRQNEREVESESARSLDVALMEKSRERAKGVGKIVERGAHGTNEQQPLSLSDGPSFERRDSSASTSHHQARSSSNVAIVCPERRSRSCCLLRTRFAGIHAVLRLHAVVVRISSE